MKAPREIKRYIAKQAKQTKRRHLQILHWDDLVVAIKLRTCKKWYKRNKKISDYEWE